MDLGVEFAHRVPEPEFLILGPSLFGVSGFDEEALDFLGLVFSGRQGLF